MNDTAWLVLALIGLINLGIAAITNRKVRACGDPQCLTTLKKEISNSHGDATVKL